MNWQRASIEARDARAKRKYPIRYKNRQQKHSAPPRPPAETQTDAYKHQDPGDDGLPPW